jgi:hypothetical protein
MPYMPTSITKRGIVGALGALAALGGPVAAANAASQASATPTACPLSQPFASLGDPAFYTLTANGSLEQGSGGWVFRNGAKIVNGNEPFYLAGARDSHSVALPAGSSALNLVSCQIGIQPPLRFAAVNTGDQSAVLEVDALTGNPASPTATPIAYVPSSPTWKVTAPIQFSVPVGGLGFRFVPLGGSWHVDDVFVDPYKRI